MACMYAMTRLAKHAKLRVIYLDHPKIHVFQQVRLCNVLRVIRNALRQSFIFEDFFEMRGFQLN